MMRIIIFFLLLFSYDSIAQVVPVAGSVEHPDLNGLFDASNDGGVTAVEEVILGTDLVIDASSAAGLEIVDLTLFEAAANGANGSAFHFLNNTGYNQLTANGIGGRLMLSLDGLQGELTIENKTGGSQLIMDTTGLQINLGVGTSGTPATDSVLKKNAAGYSYWGVDQSGGASSGGGMFDVANNGGQWTVNNASTFTTTITGANPLSDFSWSGYRNYFINTNNAISLVSTNELTFQSSSLRLLSSSITNATANNGDVWTLTNALTGEGEWVSPASGVSDGNGMFDANNENLDWNVANANLTANTFIRGVDESFNIFNNASNNENHILQIGASTNTTNRLWTSSSVEGAISGFENTKDQARILSDNGGGELYEMKVDRIAEVAQIEADGVGMTFEGGVVDQIFISGIAIVGGETSGGADSAAGAAGVPSGRLYKWDDGSAIHIMEKK